MPSGMVTDYTCASRDWPASIQHRRSDGSVLDTFQYFCTSSAGVYDREGRLKREVDGLSQTHAFTYSNYDELSAETHPDLGSSQANPHRKYTYDSGGQPISIEHRDAVWQPVKTELLDWDGTGTLRRIRDAATGTVLYAATYDGAGDRVTQTQGGVTHTFSYGARLLRNDRATGTRTYTPGVSQRNPSTDLFPHEDWLGSTRYLTASTGLTAPTAYRFDAYGNTSANGGPDGTALKLAGQHEYQSDVYGGLPQPGAR
jgi:YD repeat-containing protein